MFQHFAPKQIKRYRNYLLASMQPPVFFVYRIDRLIVAYTISVDDLRYLIVENQWLALIVHDQNRVGDFEIEVAQNDDSQVPDGNAQLSEGKILRDRVIFAIAILIKKLKWRRPVVLLAVIYRIDDVLHPVEVCIDLVDLVPQRQGFDLLQE